MNNKIINQLNKINVSPCFVTYENKICQNVAVLNTIQTRTGAKILLALKAWSQYSLFHLVSKQKSGFLHGCCASSVDEAHLAFEEFGGEVHAFAAALSDDDFDELLKYSGHFVFNSFNQWKKFKAKCTHKVCGLRINPEHSEGAVAIYNPCDPSSRLGIRLKDFERELSQNPNILDGISGLHFHTLCEQGSEELARTLDALEAKFSKYFHKLDWLNFGGGHHITKAGYNIDLLCEKILYFKNKYKLEIYLEPGEAVALDSGYLIASVLDIVEADMPIAILDASAACHTPDVLEMPYTPKIIGAESRGILQHSYRLAGKSCLAGDNFGEYSFVKPLNIGDRLYFCDMAIYSMVKTNTFNGLRLPGITSFTDNEIRKVKEFSYSDFKCRL